jgi:hypothetical protein
MEAIEEKTATWKKCGHPRTAENTSGVSARIPGGRCRICQRAHQRRYDVGEKGRTRRLRRLGIKTPRRFLDDPTRWPKCGHEKAGNTTSDGRCRTCRRASQRRRDGIKNPWRFLDDPTRWPRCGHPRTPENTRVSAKQPGGQCRTCNRAAIRRHHASKKARATNARRCTPTRISWYAMRQRCLDQRHRSYANYGGRGITVCARWELFENFLADMGVRPPGTTLDRIDVNGDYTPENCRWADAKTQRRNQRQPQAA